MANGQGLDAPVDPADPASLIRWVARAAGAFEEIRADIAEIKQTQQAGERRSIEFRIETDRKLAAGSQTMQDHGRRLTIVEQAARTFRPSNPGPDAGPRVRKDLADRGVSWRDAFFILLGLVTPVVIWLSITVLPQMIEHLGHASETPIPGLK